MIKLVYSPTWFCGKDLLIDVVSLFVLLLISGFASKCYRINKNKSYRSFSLAFGFLALSFFFKIMTNFSIYYTSLVEKNFGFFVLTYEALNRSNALLVIGFFGYFFFGLMGLMTLWRIYNKESSKPLVFLMTYFMIITAYVSMINPLAFHLTSLIFLILITTTYMRNYHESNSKNAGVLAYAFLLITFSHLTFIFMWMHPIVYVLAEVVQLAGYLMLFSVFFRITKNGKKK